MTSKTSTFAFLLCYLGALAAFPSFVNDLYLPTLPQMRLDFHASRSAVQLGLSFVMFGLGGGELFWGPLSDKLGRKPILYMSIALFCVSSAASVFSPNLSFFLLCRLFQGLGASGGVLLARAVPADEFHGREPAKIMALIGAINGIAPVAGPLVGGFLAASIGWRGIFALLTGIGILMFLLALKFKESLPPAKRQKGTLLQLARNYAPLLKNRRFMVHVMLKSAALGTLFSYISAGPFIIEEHYGYTAREFGLIFGGNAISVVIGAITALKFRTMKSAAVSGALGMTTFAVAESVAIYFFDNFWLFESLIIPMLFCAGMIFSSANTLAMNEGASEAGSASAILGLGGYVFGCIVSPLVGLGDILLSTSLALVICALIALWYGYQSYKMAPMKIQP